jgi:hypothetical protein
LTRPVRLIDRVEVVWKSVNVELANCAKPIAHVTEELSVRPVKVDDPADGIPKAKTAAELVPVFETVGVAPAASAVTVPTLIVAAAPAAPVEPVGPVGPVDPVAPVAPANPCGMVKLSTAALLVPALLTAAEDPAEPVVTVPTATVAAAPAEPVGPVGPVAPVLPAAPVAPVGPVGPVAPVVPAGIPKLKVAADDDPEFVTVGVAPADSPVTVPTLIVAAAPAGPVDPEPPSPPLGVKQSTEFPFTSIPGVA